MNEAELRIEMIRYGDNNKTLAAAIGKKPSTLCCKIKGRQRFTQPEIQTIIDRYGLSPERTTTIFFTPKVAKSETEIATNGI